MLSKDRDFSKAFNYALILLAKRDYSEQRIKEKLEKKEYSTIIIQEVINALIDNNYLNESRAVKNLTRTRFQYRHWGPYKIKKSLYNMGYNSEVVSDILSDYEDEELLHFCKEAASDYLKRNNRNELDREKLFRFLSSRGFPVHIIMKYFNEVIKPLQE